MWVCYGNGVKLSSIIKTITIIIIAVKSVKWKIFGDLNFGNNLHYGSGLKARLMHVCMHRHTKIAAIFKIGNPYSDSPNRQINSLPNFPTIQYIQWGWHNFSVCNLYYACIFAIIISSYKKGEGVTGVKKWIWMATKYYAPMQTLWALDHAWSVPSVWEFNY